MIAIVTSVVYLYIFIQTHRLKADRGVQRTLRFSITSRPFINVKSWSHMKKKPGITQKIRNDRVDQYFGRKWSKCRDVIFYHLLGNTMGAIGDRALAPMFLHPLQYGVANLGKAYSNIVCMELYYKSSIVCKTQQTKVRSYGANIGEYYPPNSYCIHYKLRLVPANFFEMS